MKMLSRKGPLPSRAHRNLPIHRETRW
jgi:hypothetical protein